MKDRYSLSFKLFYLLYFGSLGTFLPYINVYLEKYAGLTGSQIGLVTALSLMAGVCIIPLWGVAGDKTQKYNGLLKLSVAGSIVMAALYYKAATYPMIILCAAGLEMIRLGSIPMADTLATKYCHKTGCNYGSIRGMGSLGYMLASMAVGFIADKFGLDGPVFASYVFLLAISLSVCFGFPEDAKSSEIHEKDKVQKGSFKKLMTNKNFIFILAISVMTSVTVDSAMIYSGNHLVSALGGTKSSISWLTFAAVLPEIVFLTIAMKFIKKLGFRKFYILVVASMILRFGIYSVTDNTYAFLAVSIVHCLGVSLGTVGNLTYIRKSVNPAVLGTAITILNAANSVGKAVLGYIFGAVYEFGSSYGIFRISTAVFAVAFLILLRTRRFDGIDAGKRKTA
ncbi:MAG: MFS transporter [Clostridiaceae bacterium]